MAERFHTVSAEGISVKVDLDIGHLRSVEIVRDGRKLTPFYTAPWVDDPSIANDESIFPNLRGLSGDFFCAAFGRSDVEEAPPHGWPANSRWELVETSSASGGRVDRALHAAEEGDGRAADARRSSFATAIPSSTSGTFLRAASGRSPSRATR